MAGIADETQSVPVLVLVVVTAEAIEVPHRGGPTFFDGEVVVDLEVAGDVATVDVALGVELLDRAAEPSGDRAPRV